MLERPFAHTLETGAMRRVHLRNRKNILKRVLIHYAALNLSLLLRQRFSKGTPRGLQGHCVAQLMALILLWSHYEAVTSASERSGGDSNANASWPSPANLDSGNAPFATG
jgi:hypothetical protein